MQLSIQLASQSCIERPGNARIKSTHSKVYFPLKHPQVHATDHEQIKEIFHKV